MARRNLSAYDSRLVASTLSLPSAAGSPGQGDPPTVTGAGTTTTTSPMAAVFPGLHHVASSASFATANTGGHSTAGGLGLGLGLGFHGASYGLGIPVTRSLSSMTSSSAGGGQVQGRTIGTVMEDRQPHPSHPSSAWSGVVLGVMPVFIGGWCGVEEINVLVESHIKSCRTRSPRLYKRLISSDLQELISTGMLTVRAKLDGPDVRDNPERLVARMAEVWGFFWGLLPTLQGVFLPISLLAKDDHEEPPPLDTSPEAPSPNVRRLLLSGFLLHILLPILPLLIDALDPINYTTGRAPYTPHSDGAPNASRVPLAMPTPDHLARIKHMSLILSTQSRGSEFFTLTEQGRIPGSVEAGWDDGGIQDPVQRDLDNRQAVQDLLCAVAALKQDQHPGVSLLSATGIAFQNKAGGLHMGRTASNTSVFRNRTESEWKRQGPSARRREYAYDEDAVDSSSEMASVEPFDRSSRHSIISDTEGHSDDDGFLPSDTVTPGEDPTTRRPSAVSQGTLGARRGERD